MLRFVRVLSLLAPITVAGFSVAATALAARLAGQESSLLNLVIGLAMITGMTATAVLASWYFTWRLDRLSTALERTVQADEPIQLRETGVAAERRLARAFNAASGAFVLVEARANFDRLTGIPNREMLLGTLSAEVDRAARHAKPLSVAFIDIDRFKPINDTYGHKSGDIVLRQVAKLIADNIRSSDFFGRYGGEEFMLILPETLPDQALQLAEDLRSLVMEAPLRIGSGASLKMTISIGVAGTRGGEMPIEQLVEQADAAMYAAKSLGRNRTYLFREVDEEAPVHRAPISAESRAQATAIGQWASDTATEALASVLAPQPHHRGRPSDMIASLATGIGLRLNLPAEEIERIRIASLLHDLGKLAVPPEILDKPTALTDGEWQAIGEHPRIGQLILEQASSLREAIPIVLHHHERFNGGGYPHGLRGHEIPLGARIVAVADAYHAMVHERPYKEALDHREALSELKRNAGLQFDPTIVELFCALYADAPPPDGLDEVYRLHDRARDGLAHLDAPTHAHLHPRPEGATETNGTTRARRRRRAGAQGVAG